VNHSIAELDQTDEDFFCEVSDETLEAAAGTPIGGQAMVTVVTWIGWHCGLSLHRP
jgi:hypothetical protein